MKKVLMYGNEVVGEAAIIAGCKFYAGYPITPQNELTAYMARRMPEESRTFIQAESELAAINMVLGASAAGERAMTSSSSPGISLKQEGISYAAGLQLPCVIVNMMRGGPGLGNIAPSQADYFQATRGGGHGDYRTVVLAPASVQELAESTYLAFDLADKYRNPVMILGDGILGQMMEPVQFNLKRKEKLPKKDWTLTGCKGRKPNIIRSLLLGEGALEKHNQNLQEKYNKMRKNEIRCQTEGLDGNSLVIVAYGTSSRIVKSAIDKARDMGINVGLIRPITLYPFPTEIIQKTAKKAKAFLVVEMSMGQMIEDVKLAVEGKRPVHFYGRTGGGVPTPEAVLEQILKIAKK